MINATCNYCSRTGQLLVFNNMIIILLKKVKFGNFYRSAKQLLGNIRSCLGIGFLST